MRELTTIQKKRLGEAMLDAFPSKDTWQVLVVRALPDVIHLDQIVIGYNTGQIFAGVLVYVQEHNQLLELLREADAQMQGKHPGIASLLAEFQTEATAAA